VGKPRGSPVVSPNGGREGEGEGEGAGKVSRRRARGFVVPVPGRGFVWIRTSTGATNFSPGVVPGWLSLQKTAMQLGRRLCVELEQRSRCSADTHTRNTVVERLRRLDHFLCSLLNIYSA
jgi:hypothetical protein